MTTYASGWMGKLRFRPRPRVVAVELERVRRTCGGRLTPAALLASAEAASHPLHRCFEWRDGVAASKWRLEQAQTLILSVRIVREEGGQSVARRVYAEVDHGTDDAAYLTMADIAQDESLAAQVVERAREELARWEERYRDLSAQANRHVERARATLAIGARELRRPEKSPTHS